MIERLQHTALVLALAGTWLLPAGAATAAPGNEKKAPVDPQATQIIRRMDDYLEQLQAFTVAIDMGYDVVQASGQKIEFGETRHLTVRRPDHLRLEATDRDGSEHGVVFDGKDLTAFDRSSDTYATVAKSGSIDEAVSYFVEDLGMRLPMAAVFSGDLSGTVDGWATEVSRVDTATIGGVACDHLSLRGPWEDVQLWIAQGDKPLLRRIVITYTRAEGEPQFWAQLRDRDVSAAAPDSAFAFSPAEGMAKIAFGPLVKKDLSGSSATSGDEQGRIEP